MLKTTHKIIYGDSRNLNFIDTNSVDLIITSPPYPMIEMWDETFSAMNNKIDNIYDGIEKFNLMHNELNKVWKECNRVVKTGGFVVINIGDATRTVNGKFQLYSNHTKIIEYFVNMGFDILPLIIWKKTANSPNKFMGSGMLPCGAYITLEHEYILIFRKGKRLFKNQLEKNNRNNSAYFYEERNIWFNDTWNLKGINQEINSNNTRKRSGAYTVELPYRIINMFSCKDDTVLDPFLGTGTTTLASMIAERNSLGIEIDNSLSGVINKTLSNCKGESELIVNDRIKKHNNFINEYKNKKNIKNTKYYNKLLNCEVITSQEQEIDFNIIDNVVNVDNTYTVNYKKYLQENNLFNYNNEVVCNF